MNTGESSAVAGAMSTHEGEAGAEGAARGADGLPVRFVVTIDGQAATGKSTVGLELARRLGASYLDTGAMYRDATALALEQGLSLADEGAIVRAVEAQRGGMAWCAHPPHYRVWDAAFELRVRSEAVNNAVSVVAKHQGLRERMVRAQRAIGAASARLVSEGRDQGSVVFPRALAKIFLFADVRVRAQRRVEQARAMGSEMDVAAVEANLASRDALDASHALRQASDAIVVDTTRLTQAQVVEKLVAVVHAAAARA